MFVVTREWKSDMFVILLLGLVPLSQSSEPPSWLVEIRRFDPVADEMYEEVTHFQEKSGLTVRSSGAQQETCQCRQSSHLLHLLLQWSRVLWRIFLESRVLDLIQNSYIVLPGQFL